MTEMVTKSDEVRFQIMQLVEQNPNITQREIATKLGISLGRVNYCLNALAQKGWVKVENFLESGTKWRYIYVLTPSGIVKKAALTSRFIERKLREYQELRDEIEAIRPGLIKD